jgi:phage-related protein
MARKLTVEIVGDASSLEKAFSSAAGSSTKLSKAHHGLNVASLAAGATLAGLGLAARAGFAEFNEGQKVAAQTAAVIKSTGGAAKVTEKAVADLAQSISDMSGIDDEAVQAGENMLLTFTNVRNEVGRGNDIFNQATATLADMSTALGTDMSTSAVRLGKALNDPVKGVSALTRVGVTFTQGQKDQIKALVDTGNTMGAQKIILAELAKEFGGSAKAAGETFAGKLSMARNAAEGFAGELVSGAVPTLTRLAGVLQESTRWMTEHQQATKIAIGVVAGISTAILGLNIAMRIASSVTAVWTAVQWALNAALLANPVALVVAGLVVLGVALAVAWKTSERFRDVVTDTWEEVEDAARRVWGFVGPFIKTTLDGILQAARGFFNVLKGAFDVFAGVLTGDWQRVWTGIKNIASGVLDATVGVIKASFGAMGSAALDLGKHVVSSVANGLSALVARVKSIVDDVPGAIRSLLGAVGGAAIDLGERIVHGIGSGLASLGSKLVGWIKSPVNAVIGAVNSVTGRINSALSFSVDTHVPGVGKISFDAPDIPSIPSIAVGGSILTDGLAVVHAGETVVPATVASPFRGGSGGGAGDTWVFNFPNYVGSKTELIDMIRGELIRSGRRAPQVLGGLA